MTALPVLSGREVVVVLVDLVWEIARQGGSHIILVKAGHPTTLSVPDHGEVVRGTLRALIRRAGITTEQFVQRTR